ncbi:MAG TPA: hypothetical protein VGO76_03355 [Luteibacter sp.]|nr:hypothetical protein [Luteibacter sp.]
MDNVLFQRVPVEGRRVWRRMAGALVLLLCLAATSAHAQWEVVDKTGNSSLSNIDKSTSDADKQVKAINQNQTIGSATPASKYSLVDRPGMDLATAALEDGISQCTKLVDKQQANCQEIVKTQNAQYMYMSAMYKITTDRNNSLQAILQEREGIKSQEFGKLEDNTNKLTALYTLLAIDHQQMESVNFAYETRLRYLRTQQTELANAAATGNPPDSGSSINIPLLGPIDTNSLISTLTTGAALEVALRAQQSPTPSGMKTLSVGQSNGW